MSPWVEHSGIGNDIADPAGFPAEPSRQVRLEREDYFTKQSGTLQPTAILPRGRQKAGGR